MKVVIVGAGPCGCVIARHVVDTFKNAEVEIIEKRNHIAGNCYDQVDENGVLTHVYGPHCFRTNNEKQLEWLKRFSDFHEANYEVKSFVNGELYDFPVNLNTMAKILNRPVSEEDFKNYLNSNKESFEVVDDAEKQVLSTLGRKLYEMFFKGYTTKQWGVSPDKHEPEVTARIPVRFNKEVKYVTEKYQMMPSEGYTKLFENMISSPKIKVKLNTDFFEAKDKLKYDVLIYTGELDRFFNFELGRLKYRSLRFELKPFKNTNFTQKYLQINYPNDFEYTRVVEIKHVTHQQIPHTNLVFEYPEAQGEPYYPFFDLKNKQLAEKYKQIAKKLESKGIFFVGRLADFKYYNTNQAMDAAEELFNSKLRPYLNTLYL